MKTNIEDKNILTMTDKEWKQWLKERDDNGKIIDEYLDKEFTKMGKERRVNENV